MLHAPFLFRFQFARCTLKRISNWPLYKIRYYATYLINASKVWLLWIVHTNLSINRKKKTYTTVHAERQVLGFLVHGKVVVKAHQQCLQQTACKHSDGLNKYKSYGPLVGPIETQGSCTAAATKSQGVHACFSSDVCGHSTTVYLQTHFFQGVHGTPCCRCDTRWM